jgi:Haem-binding domain
MKGRASLLASMAVVLALLQFLSCKQIDPAHEHRYPEPFRGEQVSGKLRQACGDCHSNQTIWPWYSHIVPVSGWIRSHVRQGQNQLNFSDWQTYSAAKRRSELESICGIIHTGRMPPGSYTLMHPRARLSVKDKQAICSWANSELQRDK